MRIKKMARMMHIMMMVTKDGGGASVARLSGCAPLCFCVYIGHDGGGGGQLNEAVRPITVIIFDMVKLQKRIDDSRVEQSTLQ